MYVNIIIYSNKLLLFVWSTLKKEKKRKKKVAEMVNKTKVVYKNLTFSKFKTLKTVTLFCVVNFYKI